jgi:GTP cyclohydrolase II
VVMLRIMLECKVSDQYAASVCKKQEEADAAAAAAAGAEKSEEGTDVYDQEN